MFNRKKSTNTLYQPKVFQAPREQLPKIWSKFLFFLILIILILSGIFYVIFFSSWFKIKNIEIIGNPSTQIRTQLDQFKGKNIFSFKSASLEKELLNSNRNFLTVKIYRGIPDTIRVVFENRIPKLIWQTANQKYFVDENAIIFEEADNSADLPLVIDKSNLAIEIPKQIATTNFVDFVKSVDSELVNLKIKIKNYEVSETTFQVTAVASDDLNIIFNTLRPVSEQIDAFKKVYETSKADIREYIDLRVEGKVYYK